MRYIISTLVISLSLFACSEPKDDRATAVCDCYKELGRINPDKDLELMNVVADSCNALYINVLTELEGNAEEKAKFDEAYEFCQNEK